MIRTEQIDAGRVNGHIAHAERPRGGVLVLPTITAVDASDARARASCWPRRASRRWSGTPIRARRRRRICRAAQARAGKLNDGAVDSMADCVSHMLDKLKLPAVAVLGFCLGGRYAAAARRRATSGCSPACPIIRRSACR